MREFGTIELYSWIISPLHGAPFSHVIGSISAIVAGIQVIVVSHVSLDEMPCPSMGAGTCLYSMSGMICMECNIYDCHPIHERLSHD
jgi:hypothetical protein